MKIGTIQRRLAWPLRKDDMQIREACSIFLWGMHVNPWLIHVNVWQKPLQYCKVISLQLIKIKKKKIYFIIQTENQYRNTDFKWHIRSDELNRFTQNIPPQSTTNMFFSSKYGTFSSIDQMLGHKRNLNKFKKTEIWSGIFSHIMVWLEINCKKSGQFTNIG